LLGSPVGEIYNDTCHRFALPGSTRRAQDLPNPVGFPLPAVYKGQLLCWRVTTANILIPNLNKE
jgi:hypothetical protein